MDPRATASTNGEPRPTSKALALQVIAALPDDASFDEVIRRLQSVYELQRGGDDVAGHMLPQDETQRQMALWLA